MLGLASDEGPSNSSKPKTYYHYLFIYLFSIILYYYNMKNIKMLRTLTFIFFNYIDKNVNF